MSSASTRTPTSDELSVGQSDEHLNSYVAAIFGITVSPLHHSPIEEENVRLTMAAMITTVPKQQGLRTYDRFEINKYFAYLQLCQYIGLHMSLVHQTQQRTP